MNDEVPMSLGLVLMLVLAVAGALSLATLVIWTGMRVLAML